MIDLLPTVLRLLVVASFLVLAVEDIRTRTCPQWVWVPIILGALLAIGVDTSRAYGTHAWFWHWFRIAGAVGILSPIAGLIVVSAAGNADAKAIFALALAFPVPPVLVWPTGIPFALVVFLVTAVLAVAGTLGLAVLDRLDRGVPFLAYLAGGLLVALVAGHPLLLAMPV